jgi:hypothetical protein
MVIIAGSFPSMPTGFFSKKPAVGIPAFYNIFGKISIEKYIFL